VNAKETVALTRLVAAVCPQQAIDDYTPDAWFDLLCDLSLGDCRAAVAAVGRRQAFIAPADIRAEVRRIREDRLARTPVTAPPAELADQPGRYQRAIQAGLRRIADGMRLPKAIAAGPLPGDPPKEWQDAAAALGTGAEPRGAVRDLRAVAAAQVRESRAARGETP